MSAPQPKATQDAAGTTRIARRFADLRAAGRGGLVTFISAGDPDLDTSLALLKGLVGAGADLIELGMPFSDPVADGPSIQISSQRGLKAGITLLKTLDMVRAFRAGDDETPLILMGYFNPIHHYGAERFATDAVAAGLDGIIIVDLPPEEDPELHAPAKAAGLDFIRLVTPTTDDTRLERILLGASGFVYYVSITGVTGAATGAEDEIARAVGRIRAGCDLPVAVGFGIKTPAHAASVARTADAAVVGSALVDTIADHLKPDGTAKPGLVASVLDLVGDLSRAVRGG